MLRAVHLLKWIGTPAAGNLLDELAREDDPELSDEIASVRRVLDAKEK